jgi:hypothetical protein
MQIRRIGLGIIYRSSMAAALLRQKTGLSRRRLLAQGATIRVAACRWRR